MNTMEERLLELINKTQADLDYIAIMMGVELDEQEL